MTAVERFFLWIMDWDPTWYGLGWLRPTKQQRISAWRLLLISFVLSLPGFVVSMAMLFLCFRQLDPEVCLAMLGAIVLLELGLNGLSVCFWNRRAATLSRQARDLC